MRVLIVGQLPVEMGGNYTTGIARVIAELSKHSFANEEVYVYGTNISYKKAQKLNHLGLSQNKYIGYTINPFGMFWQMLSHPKQIFEAIKDYKKHGGASILHLEFFRYNFSRIINRVKPDLINYHGSGFIAMYHANKQFNVPILLTLHGLMWSGIDSKDPREIEWKRSSELTLPLAKRYTTLNENALKKMLKLGVKREYVDIIPNGVDARKFYYSADARNTVRNQFCVNTDQLVFITVGVVIDRKGQFSFLKILETLNIDYQYWIIGKGPDEDKIKDYVNSNHLDNRVKLLGYVKDTDLYKYLSAADFYAHSSTVEGQALSEIEAYSTGLRVIVNEIISETVIGNVSEDRERYFVLNFDDPDKKNLLRWFSHNWLRVSTLKYDWSNIANLYAEVYKNIIRL